MAPRGADLTVYDGNGTSVLDSVAVDGAIQANTGGGPCNVLFASDVTLVPGTLDTGNHGDDVTTGILLPFPVGFYDQTFMSATVCSNGNLQFNGANSAFSNSCLPTSSMNNLIAPHWDDLRTDSFGSGIFTRNTGSSPNRVFHVEWRTTYFSGSGTTNFELRLHENSSAFEIVYGVIGQNAAGATIGCQRDTGSHSTSHACNVSGSVPFGTKLSFTLPGCPDGGGECVNNC